MTMLRARLGVLIGLSALVGLLVWLALPATTEEPLPERTVGLLGPLEAEAIVAVRLSNRYGQLALQRRGDSWFFTSPADIAADPQGVDEVLTGLLSAQCTPLSRVNGDAHILPSLEELGLQPPRATVQLDTADGRTLTLAGGVRNRFDDRIYILPEGGGLPLLCPGALRYLLERTAENLRDRLLLPFERNTLQALTVTLNDGSGFAIEQREDGPWLTVPRPARADEELVEELLQHLSRVRGRRFLEPSPHRPSLAQLGLAPPAMRIALHLRGSDAPLTLLLSQPRSEGEEAHYYLAKRADRDEVAEVDGDWLPRHLVRAPEALRDRRVVHFSRGEVATVVVRQEGAEARFVKRSDSERGRDTWHQVAPRKVKAKDSELFGLLYRLWRMRAVETVAKEAIPERMQRYGLTAPFTEISLQDADGSVLATVRFGGFSGGARYLYTAEGDRIFLVAAPQLEGIVFSPAHYEEGTP